MIQIVSHKLYIDCFGEVTGVWKADNIQILGHLDSHSYSKVDISEKPINTTPLLGKFNVVAHTREPLLLILDSGSSNIVEIGLIYYVSKELVCLYIITCSFTVSEASDVKSLVKVIDYLKKELQLLGAERRGTGPVLEKDNNKLFRPSGHNTVIPVKYSQVTVGKDGEILSLERFKDFDLPSCISVGGNISDVAEKVLPATPSELKSYSEQAITKQEQVVIPGVLVLPNRRVPIAITLEPIIEGPGELLITYHIHKLEEDELEYLANLD